MEQVAIVCFEFLFLFDLLKKKNRFVYKESNIKFNCYNSFEYTNFL